MTRCYTGGVLSRTLWHGNIQLMFLLKKTSKKPQWAVGCCARHWFNWTCNPGSYQLASSRLANNMTQKYWSMTGITMHFWTPYMNSAYWEEILLTAFEMASNINIERTVTTSLFLCSHLTTYIIKYWGNFTCLTTYLTNGLDQCWRNLFARGSLWLRKIIADPHILAPLIKRVRILSVQNLKK